MVDEGLSHSYFSSRKPIYNENYRGVGYTVARLVFECRLVLGERSVKEQDVNINRSKSQLQVLSGKR